MDHLGNTLHHIGELEDGRAVAHHVGDRPAIAGAFDDLVGDDRDRLRIIQFQPARLTAPGQVGGRDDEQLFAFAGGQMHGGKVAGGE